MTQLSTFLASPRAKWAAALAWLLLAAAAGIVAGGLADAEKNDVVFAVFCLGLLGYETGMTHASSEGQKPGDDDPEGGRGAGWARRNAAFTDGS